MNDFFRDWQKKPLGEVILSLIRTWLRGLVKPDPWPEEIDREVRMPEAIPVCHRCFLPLEYEKNRWFCSDCGAAVGPYNNILPYIRIFSIGEVLRSGVGPEASFTKFTVCGYVLLGYLQFWPSFLFYLIRLCRNILRKKESAEAEGKDKGTYNRLLWVALFFSALLLTTTAFTLWPFVVNTSHVSVKTNDIEYSEIPRGSSSLIASDIPADTTPIDIHHEPPIDEPSSPSPTQRFYRININAESL